MRVLIVDDDPFTLTILQKRILSGGYVVETACNGREGLEKYESFHPDLILSDWMMPEMDGREFCAHVKAAEEGRTVYFILLTAKDRKDDMVSALDTGADEYLVKPCDSQELMARLRAAQRILHLQNQLSRSNTDLQRAIERINEELLATSQIQRSMLPATLPDIRDYQFAAYYQPSYECSGDFYDVLPAEDGRLWIIIGDVSGHGTPAMVAMALTHMLLHIEAPRSSDPAQLLETINRQMFSYLPTGQFVTIFAGLLTPESGVITYSSAGHNPPLLADISGSSFQYLPHCEGFPVKLIDPDVTYVNHRIEIDPGQMLVLYTDGLPDAFNPEGRCFGNDSLSNCVVASTDASPAKLIQSILDDLQIFTEGHPLDDDLSLLVVMRQ